MVYKNFKIKKKDFEKKPITIFYHKLKIFLKCYTIKDLVLDEINYSFKFKKSYKINGIKFLINEENSGSYEILNCEDDEFIILKLII